jgi:hypothetical protein
MRIEYLETARFLMSIVHYITKTTVLDLHRRQKIAVSAAALHAAIRVLHDTNRQLVNIVGID